MACVSIEERLHSAKKNGKVGTVVARRMLVLNKPIGDIMEITGLTRKEVKNLRKLSKS